MTILVARRENEARVQDVSLLPGKGEVIGLMATVFALAPGARLGKSRFVEAAAHVRLKEEAQRRARVAVSVGFQAAAVELLRRAVAPREWTLDEASQSRYHSLHVVLRRHSLRVLCQGGVAGEAAEVQGSKRGKAGAERAPLK